MYKRECVVLLLYIVLSVSPGPQKRRLCLSAVYLSWTAYTWRGVCSLTALKVHLSPAAPEPSIRAENEAEIKWNSNS